MVFSKSGIFTTYIYAYFFYDYDFSRHCIFYLLYGIFDKDMETLNIVIGAIAAGIFSLVSLAGVIIIGYIALKI